MHAFMIKILNLCITIPLLVFFFDHITNGCGVVFPIPIHNQHKFSITTLTMHRYMSFITLSHKLSADSFLSHYKRVLLVKEQSFCDLITSLHTREPSEQYVPDSDMKIGAQALTRFPKKGSLKADLNCFRQCFGVDPIQFAEIEGRRFYYHNANFV